MFPTETVSPNLDKTHFFQGVQNDLDSQQYIQNNTDCNTPLETYLLQILKKKRKYWAQGLHVELWNEVKVWADRSVIFSYDRLNVSNGRNCYLEFKVIRVGHSAMTRSWSVDRFSMRCDTTGCHFTTNACPVCFRSFNVFKSVQNRYATNLVAGICVLVRSLVAIHENVTTTYVWHTSRIIVARQSTDLHEMKHYTCIEAKLLLSLYSSYWHQVIAKQ